MTPMVQVQDLRKQYNPPQGVEAVKGVTFEIERGTIFSLLGPNGAGKTTLISMLSCLLAPSGGDALIDGHSITRQPAAVKAAIGVVPQDIALYPAISANENLVFWGKMYGLSAARLKQRVADVLAAVDLADRARDKVATFSGGMKRRLNIAVGLLHEPRLLFLDEPTVGIDPQSRRRILDIIKELNRQGMTVLYTTHYMEEAEELSDRIGIVDAGRMLALGTQAELTKLVGQHSSVCIEIEPEVAEPDALVDKFSRLPQIQRAVRENGSLVLQVADVSAALPALFARAGDVGLPIRRLQIQEPNLETVFLHLTGRALRD